jgi:hypothetical protein
LHPGARWGAAVAAGVIVFEGLDLLGSSPLVVGWIPAAASLTAISPFLCGAAAAGGVRQHAVPAVLAAAAAVWVRIAVDSVIGTLQGAHPFSEAGLLLVVQGTVWMPAAIAGAVGAVLVRGAVRRIRAARARRISAPRA